MNTFAVRHVFFTLDFQKGFTFCIYLLNGSDLANFRSENVSLVNLRAGAPAISDFNREWQIREVSSLVCQIVGGINPIHQNFLCFKV